jgi:hypothetical protein
VPSFARWLRRNGYRVLVGVLVLAATISLVPACLDTAARFVSTQRQDWAYVDSHLGGMRLDVVSATGDDLVLRPQFCLHETAAVDSGICVREIQARFAERQIEVRLWTCVCSGDADDRVTKVSLADVPPGRWPVLFEDRDGTLHPIGELEGPAPPPARAR